MEGELEPTVEEYVFIGHSVGGAEPPRHHDPAAQREPDTVDEPPAQLLPGGAAHGTHAVGDEAPATLPYKPALHGVGRAVPPAHHDPAGQSTPVALVEPDGHHLPGSAAHGRHPNVPFIDEKYPAEHTANVIWTDCKNGCREKVIRIVAAMLSQQIPDAPQSRWGRQCSHRFR